MVSDLVLRSFREPVLHSRACISFLQDPFSLDIAVLQERDVDINSCGIFRDAVLSILATIAKQERVRRCERALAAIARPRRAGKTDHLGRPRKVVDRDKARKLHPQSLGVRAIADQLGVSHITVQRIVIA